MKTHSFPFLPILVIGFFILSSCHKEPQHNPACNHTGIIKDAAQLDLACTGLFIADDAGTLFQPVSGTELLHNFKPEDRIRFGYQPMYLGMWSCASTIKLTCVEKK